MLETNMTSSKKQYKVKITEWGLTKYIRPQDAVRMLTIRTSRHLEGKPTDFEINGKPVNLDSYVRRSKLFQRRNPDCSRPKELPYYVRPCKPPVETVELGLLRSPGDIGAAELVFSFFKSLPPSAMTVEPKLNSPYASRIIGTMQVFEQLSRASWLFDENYHVDAGQLSRRAFLQLEPLHETSFPQFLLLVMYGSILYPVNRGILLQLWKYITARTEIMYGKSTVTYQLAAAVNRIIAINGPRAYFQLMPEMIEKVLGLDSKYERPPIDEIVLGVMNMEMRDELQQTTETEHLIQERLYRARRTPFGLDTIPAIQAYSSCFGVGKLKKWPPLTQFKVTRERTTMGGWLNLSSIARAEKKRCENMPLAGNPRHYLACYYLEQSTNHRLKATELEPYVLKDLCLLEQWHREGGDFLRAQTVRQRYEEAVATFLQIQRSDLADSSVF